MKTSSSTAGRELDKHDLPGEATVHLLQGRVHLSSGDQSREGSPGDLLAVPVARHGLEALEGPAGAGRTRAVIRIVVGGGAGMAFTYLIGRLLGPTTL